MKRLKQLKRKIAIWLCVALIASGNLSSISFVFADEISDTRLSTRSSAISTESDIDSFIESCEDEEDDGTDIYYEEEPEEDEQDDSVSTVSEVSEEIDEAEQETEPEEDIEEEETVATESECVIELDKVVEEEVIATDSEIDIATESELDINVLFGVNPVEASVSEVEIEHGLGYISPNIDPPTVVARRQMLFGDASIPATYDARTITNSSGMSIVSPIRNQGNFGVCWAFSTIGMIETSIRKKNLVTNETDSNLSEAALAYFYYNLENIYNQDPQYVGKPAVSGKDYNKLASGSWSQTGGSQLNATLFMSTYAGAVKENADTKYEKMSNIESSGLDWNYAFNSNAFELGNVRYINKSDKNAIKKAIMDNGSAGLSYYEAGGGYRNQVGDEYYHMFAKSNADNPFCQANHAVMIVGWDDTIPASNFVTHGDDTLPDCDGGWLIRNSWGGDDVDPLHQSHMKDGYFWMSYDERTIDDIIYSIDAIKADTYKYNYYYDGSASSWSAVSFSQGSKLGHVFKVKGDEEQVLEAVNVGIGSTNSTFDIKVYTKATAMSNPEDGTLAATQTDVNVETAGLHTIPLSTKVTLPLDTYFSVVICPKTSSGGNNVSFYFDMTNTGSTVRFYNQQSRGQTYTSYGSSWSDACSSGDNSYGTDLTIRIKALTNPGVGVGFDANGGEGTMDRLNGVVGDTVTIPANSFTREGYTFVKWTTNADGSGTEYNTGDSITLTDAAVTLYAKWSPIHYTLALNPNGQSGTETSQSYAYDEEVNLANPSFTSTDYSFGGWQTTSGTSEKVYDEDESDVKGLSSTEGDTVTLYAHWIPGAYNVRFNANGGEGTMGLQSITRDESTALVANAFTKTGYTFANWNTESGGTGDTYNNTQSVLNLASKDATFDLYAQWTPITYTIVYNTKGGTITPTSTSKTYDTTLTLDTPTKTGYTFAGWYSDDTLSTSYNGSTDLSSTQGASVTIYAKWTLAAGYVEVKYESNGGSGVEPQAVLSGGTYTRPSNPSKSGYTFDNWYKESGLINVYDFSSIATQSIILYAKWNQVVNNDTGRRRSSGSGSGGGGGGSGVNVGPLAKELAKNNAPKQESAKQVPSRTVDVVVTLISINWQVDPVTGAIKLGLDKNNPSTIAANGFFAIPSMDAFGNAKNDIYNFDAEGNMVTGWAKDAEGRMYFFETEEGQNIGKMLENAWKEVGTGNWYYFGADGKMMTSGMTPDGYMVGANGLWQ